MSYLSYIVWAWSLGRQKAGVGGFLSLKRGGLYMDDRVVGTILSRWL